jgi:HAD superfamily hydrolase (TIGR01450 family)
MKLNLINVFFFDMDGVLSVGKERPRYLGGREVISQIKSSGKQAYILTNDSTHTRNEIHDSLMRLGFSFAFDEVLTSSYLTALYLKERFGRNVSFYLVGERGLDYELRAAGHSPDEEHPDVVVVGLDRELSYQKLNSAVNLLRSGAFLVGSYGGAVYMGDHGPALSAGPIIKALECGSGKGAMIVGKPSPVMFRFALKLSHQHPSRAVMVGDQIETDLLGAHKTGVHTVLVLSGVETRETLKNSKVKPELVLENVEALKRYL